MFEKFDDNVNLENKDTTARIKIIGVGGGGTNAVNKMVDSKIFGLEFYIANTDNQALKNSKVQNKILLGNALTKGLGAGANPEVGQKAAIESSDAIKAIVEDADLVFITIGMGGGTGSGAGPVIAKLSKDAGALVVAIVTTPFDFEGRKRAENAKEALQKIKEVADSVIVVSNNRLLAELGEIPLTDSFQYSDAILKQAVRTITELINKHSLINLDFADIKTVIANQGLALIGTGKAAGENAAVEAAIQAINSPILESSIKGAKNAIVNVLGGPKALTIQQAEEAVQTIKDAASSNVDIIFGVTISEELGDEIVVSVIATGLQHIREEGTIASGAKGREILTPDEVDIQKYKEVNPKDGFLYGDETFGNFEQTSEEVLFSLSLLEDTVEEKLNLVAMDHNLKEKKENN